VHPEAEGAALVEEMVAAAEACLAITDPQGRRTLRVWVHADDHGRQALLTTRGYRKGGGPEHQRRRSMALPIPETPVPAGYHIRAVGDASDMPARSWVSWKAFHPDEPDEHHQGWAWYRNVQRVPLYRRDLDVVAVAPNGEHAAFSTAWLDDVTRTVVFEPVGTHPNHRQRGLGKAVMAEGLRRALWLGAEQATVSSYSAAAHALYESLGFVDFDLLEPWERAW
jgi:mycothiol synthase